jgi:hypothetical protein
MLRLVELALFLAPFAVFAVWRLVAVDGPSVRLLLTAACVLAALAGVLIWLSQDEALPPGSTYVPAQLQNGRVVAGHAVPR